MSTKKKRVIIQSILTSFRFRRRRLGNVNLVVRGGSGIGNSI